MSKKTDIVQNFLSMVEEREKLLKKTKDKKISLSLVLGFILLIVFAVFSITTNTPLFPGNTLKKQGFDIKKLQVAVEQNNVELQNLKKNLMENKSPSFNYLNSEIISMKEKNQYLYTTILKNPDTAITPIILRNEQDNINEKIDNLQKRVDTTNNWLIGIFTTLIVGLIIFIAKQVWDNIFSNKKSIKE